MWIAYYILLDRASGAHFPILFWNQSIFDVIDSKFSSRGCQCASIEIIAWNDLVVIAFSCYQSFIVINSQFVMVIRHFKCCRKIKFHHRSMDERRERDLIDDILWIFWNWLWVEIKNRITRCLFELKWEGAIIYKISHKLEGNSILGINF